MRRPFFVGLALLAMASVPGVSHAQGSRTLGADASEAAEQRYQSALTLYRKRQFADAVREFRVALKLMPDSPRLTFNLARTLERAGEVEQAVAAYARYLELAPEAKDREVVRQTMAALRDELAARRVSLVVTSNPTGAQVFLDSSTTSGGTTPATLEVAPGPHVVAVDLAGYERASLAVQAEAGKGAAVEVVLVPSAAEVQSSAGGVGWRPVTGWSAVAAGGVAGAVGVWFYVQGRDTTDDFDDTVGDQQAYDDKKAELDGQDIAKNVSWVVGGALAVLGATLLLWPDAPAEAEGTAVLTPGGVGVRW